MRFKTFLYLYDISVSLCQENGLQSVLQGRFSDMIVLSWCFTMMLSFIYMIFIMFIYVDFVWYKHGIMWLYDIFLLWIFSFLLRYIHIIFIWLIYNLLVIDLFLSDCSIIMVLFFVIIVWFFVVCHGLFWSVLGWYIIDIIVCNVLCYKGL